MSNLQPYLKAFARLKRGGTKYGLAPYKPILLLTLVELIEKGLDQENHFQVNGDWSVSFRKTGAYYCDRKVVDSNFPPEYKARNR